MVRGVELIAWEMSRVVSDVARDCRGVARKASRVARVCHGVAREASRVAREASQVAREACWKARVTYKQRLGTMSGMYPQMLCGVVSLWSARYQAIP